MRAEGERVDDGDQETGVTYLVRLKSGVMIEHTRKELEQLWKDVDRYAVKADTSAWRKWADTLHPIEAADIHAALDYEEAERAAVSAQPPLARDAEEER